MSDSTNYTGRVYNDPAYRIAKSMYIAIGGDANITFENTDEIYEAINGIYAESGGRIAIEPLNMILSSNGHYTFDDEDITGYKPVNIEVDVEQKYTDEYVADLEKTSWYEGYEYGWKDGHNEGYSVGESEGYADGYAEGLDDGAEEQKTLLESITITENGTYNREDGWNAVTVEVPTSGGGSGGDGLDFESIGWDAAYSKEINNKFKSDLEYSRQKLEYINNAPVGQITLNGDRQLVFGPKIDYRGSQATFANVCQNCTSLLVAPVFENYTSIFISSCSGMFQNCSSLTTVPLFNTGYVTNMYGMFQNCSSLQNAPHLDTGNVTDMGYMFRNCSALTYVPSFYTVSATNMSYMFYGCTSLQNAPHLDTGNVTNMSYMFGSCNSLQSVPQYDTSNVTNMNYMFQNCYALTSVSKLDMSNVTSTTYMFQYCNALTDIDGLTNFGMPSNFNSMTKYSSPFNNCKAITRESVINVFNGLYDRATAGYSNLTIYFAEDVINRLTEDDIAIATNKGWTISQ